MHGMKIKFTLDVAGALIAVQRFLLHVAPHAPQDPVNRHAAPGRKDPHDRVHLIPAFFPDLSRSRRNGDDGATLKISPEHREDLFGEKKGETRSSMRFIGRQQGFYLVRVRKNRGDAVKMVFGRPAPHAEILFRYQRLAASGACGLFRARQGFGASPAQRKRYRRIDFRLAEYAESREYFLNQTHRAEIFCYHSSLTRKESEKYAKTDIQRICDSAVLI